MNFWRAENLTVERVEKAVRFGREGTAMQSFASRLTDDEIEAVAIYVTSGLTGGAAYHTPENGWPDHKARNGAAYPFVTGEVAIDTPDASLSAAEREGLALFRSACAICHDGERDPESANIFRPFGSAQITPVQAAATESAASQAVSAETAAEPAEAAPRRRTGDCSRCHDDFDSSGNPLTRRAASEDYGPGPHDVLPVINGLTPSQTRGRDLYQKACADCHAADGTGANWVGRFLERSPTDFSSPEYAATYERDGFIRAVQSGIAGESMPQFSSVFTDEEFGALADYVERAFVNSDE